MAETSRSVKNRMQDIGNQFEHATASAAGTVAAVAEDVSQRAQEFISDATERVENAGMYFNRRADDATMAVGDQLKAAGDASATMGQRLRETGDYLQKEGLSGICSDMATLIKNNPIPSILMGVGFGFLMARAIYHHES